MSQRITVVVTAKYPLGDGIVGLDLATAGGMALPAWQPGAHVDLHLTASLTRQYSLCGAPDDVSRYRLAVQQERHGRGGSDYVHTALGVGDQLRLTGPRNNFALVAASRYLFIAGGIGITPIRPMLDAAGAPWQLVYGGRTRASMAFLSELEPRAQVRVCPQDETGLLDVAAIVGSVTSDTVIYCCGPQPLLAAVEQAVRERPHLDAQALHVERFTPQPLGAAEMTSFEVELSHSGMTLTVPADCSILEAVERAGVFPLSSCREGTCGTCETEVLAGQPDHRDSLLTEQERQRNDVMFICVSRSRTPRLVLAL